MSRFFWMAPDLVRLEALGLGCLFAVGVTPLHITGLNYIMNWSQEKSRELREKAAPSFTASWYFPVTILLTLLRHICDAVVWGGASYTR
ncbi:MAG TPA: hypothetical protein VEJ45_10780 [Candidatus Acidoferrales bacterium]|nr:hypothetical protein [Candidatus Acidoferrales bacterium]